MLSYWSCVFFLIYKFVIFYLLKLFRVASYSLVFPFEVWHTQINTLCKLCGRQLKMNLRLRKTECYLYIVHVLQQVAYLHSKGMKWRARARLREAFKNCCSWIPLLLWDCQRRVWSRAPLWLKLKHIYHLMLCLVYAIIMLSLLLWTCRGFKRSKNKKLVRLKYRKVLLSSSSVSSSLSAALRPA